MSLNRVAAHQLETQMKTNFKFLAIGWMFVVLTGCQQDGSASSNGVNPGWTGRTTVPGNNSTIAGDAAATYDQQKWQLGPRR